MSEVKKPAWKSPEFMAAIRVKAAEKRAETTKIKNAEKFKAQAERKAKLDEAEKILNPQPDPEPEPEENVPLQKSTKTAKRATAPRRELDNDDAKPEISYKERYYQRKLELLDQKDQAPPQPIKQNPAYVVAKHEIAKHVNKSVMDNLWKTYFKDSPSPYE